MSLLAAIGLARLVTAAATCPAALSQGQTATILCPEPNAPGQASKLVDLSFASFGIQGSSFPAFTGLTPFSQALGNRWVGGTNRLTGNASHPNTFSRNLIRQIEERTGGPLVVRVGGTNTFVTFPPVLDVFSPPST